MLKNYFLIAWRNLVRNKVFAFINLLGLSIGISSALVIFLIVQYHFSFDRFEPDRERIYRVVTDMSFAGSPFYNSGVPAPMPAAVRNEIPGLKSVVAFHLTNGNPKVSVRNGGKVAVFRDREKIIFADAAYFSLIPYEWVAGSSGNPLAKPFQVVLTETRARSYFPGQPLSAIIGRLVAYDDSVIATVTGIVKTQASRTDFDFQEFISLATIPEGHLKAIYGWDAWNETNGNSQLFIKLTTPADVPRVESRLGVLLKKYDPNVNKDPKSTTVLRLQPLSDLHFNALYHSFENPSANRPTLYALLGVAGFLLVLGCINFINLSTAQATQRAKEIGVRKTMGSTRGQLVFQFLNETFLLTLAATVLSVLIVPLLLRVFGDFIPPDLHFNLLQQPGLLLFLVALVLVVTVLSGVYPALVLSRFRPVLVLKNNAMTAGGASRKSYLRKSLTVSQFFIAQVFVMATLITVKQIHFMVNKDMGFSKDAILTFDVPVNWTANGPSRTDKRRYVLFDAIRNIPGIRLASLGSDKPSSGGWSSMILTFKDGKKEVTEEVRMKYGDTNYLRLYHIPVLAGRNVRASDTTREYLINETYLHILGFRKPGDAVGRMIDGIPIAGVIADFNQESLHAAVKPIAFSANAYQSLMFSIALVPDAAGGNAWKQTIAALTKKFKAVYPEDDFRYEFFDESIAHFYKAEQDISTLLQWATGLAIFISCMGLLGLVIYTTNQRRKEIGVRKVLGASIGNILALLSRDFLALVLIAFALATPVAWWCMHRWLENFNYRTSLSWWVFAASGLGLIVLSVITLSLQTIRAAAANPVTSLRSE